MQGALVNGTSEYRRVSVTGMDIAGYYNALFGDLGILYEKQN